MTVSTYTGFIIEGSSTDEDTLVRQRYYAGIAE